MSVSHPGGVLTSNQAFHMTSRPTAPSVKLGATSLKCASQAAGTSSRAQKVTLTYSGTGTTARTPGLGQNLMVERGPGGF